MRIDKFLKVSRVLKRRSLGKEACESGKVYINNKQVKPSHEVKPGDICSIRFANGSINFKVLEIKEFCKKEEIYKLYEIIEEENNG